jgi:hypothetical protein
MKTHPFGSISNETLIFNDNIQNNPINQSGGISRRENRFVQTVSKMEPV